MKNGKHTPNYKINIYTPQVSASELVIDKSIKIVYRNDKRKNKQKLSIT